MNKLRNKCMKGIPCTILLLLLFSCTAKEKKPGRTESERGIYHWKTIYNPTPSELDFMAKHRVKKLYLKMFDVTSGETEAVPSPTTQFRQLPPEGVEVIPTVYITLDAMRMMANKEVEYAHKIVTRILAMVNYNSLGPVKEVQFDCDWTASTKDAYFQLCSDARLKLMESGIQLSSTIRLHQLAADCPPVDKGVLMLYNTGALKNVDTENSILDYDDVKPYLIKEMKYPIPLEPAFPAYGWEVMFGKDGEFAGIKGGKSVRNHASRNPSNDYDVRQERGTMEHILKTKALVKERIMSLTPSNIIYHLDSTELSNYSYDEIEQIYQ